MAKTVRIAVLGCSTGAEVYSIAWSLRSTRPDLKLCMKAIDISPEAVNIAKSGVYSPVVSQITGSDMFDGITDAEMQELFDRKEDSPTIKSWIQNGIEWHVGDVARSERRSRGH